MNIPRLNKQSCKSRPLKKLILLLVVSLVSIMATAEEKLDSTDNSAKYEYYELLSSGFTVNTFRDKSTSPLYYNGLGFRMTDGWLKLSIEKERLFQMGLGFSFLVDGAPESNLIQPSSSALFGQLSLRYQQLWRIERFSDAKTNVKLGGRVRSTQNIRYNASLQNNSLGIENLSNLGAAMQVRRDISRKESKTLNLWLINPTLEPVKRSLRGLLNVGVLNANFRPGYAYSYDSELIGIETSPISWIFSNYGWSINGWRINTEVEFIKYLPNGTAKSWAYLWEAAHAPGQHESFDMGSHYIRFTYYFKLDKD